MWFATAASGQDSGGPRAKADSCSELFYWIQREYMQGHNQVMDSLVREYRNNGCNNIDLAHTIEILTMIRRQRLEDNYRIKEADSIQKIIEAKTAEQRIGTRYDALRMRVGVGLTFNYPFSIDYVSKEDMAFFGSFSPHITVGYRFDNRRAGNNITYWAVDGEYSYQEIKFSFNARNNKDENNNNFADGFILKTSGRNEFHKFSGIVSRNKEPLNSGFGYGAFAGIEIFQTWNTHVNKYYYEYGYTDSIVQVNGQTSQVLSHYSVFSQQNYDNCNFFSNDVLFNIPVGVNVHAKAGAQFMATLSIYASIPTGKLELSSIDYSRDIGYFGTKLTASYIFMRKHLR